MPKISVLAQRLASRRRRLPVSTIVLHATAGRSLAGALAALRDRELSYHYIVSKDGNVTKCVDVGRCAFHAGVAQGPEGSAVNDYSVGVSMVNLNDGLDPYPPEQVAKVRELVSELAEAEPGIRWITTHKQLSHPRKSDPAGFPVGLVRGRLPFWRRDGVPL